MRLAVALSALLLAGCGASGGGGLGDPIRLRLGSWSPQGRHIVPQTVLNPLAETARVTLAGSRGPFSLVPVAEVLAGAAFSLPVVFTPGGKGEAEGWIRVRFQGRRAAKEQRYEVEARGEDAPLGLYGLWYCLVARGE